GRGAVAADASRALMPLPAGTLGSEPRFRGGVRQPSTPQLPRSADINRHNGARPVASAPNCVRLPTRTRQSGPGRVDFAEYCSPGDTNSAGRAGTPSRWSVLFESGAMRRGWWGGILRGPSGAAARQLAPF